MINGKKFEDLTVKEIQTICDNSHECHGCPFNVGDGNYCCVFAYSPTEWVYEDKSIEWLKKVISVLEDAYSILYNQYDNSLVVYNESENELVRFKRFPEELKGIKAKVDEI